MAHDTSRMLYQLCEPVSTLAYLKGRAYNAEQYEQWARALLQNAVHDCICGVSIDQVHEKMEYTYRQVFDGAQAELNQAIDYLLSDFAAGTYAISTNAYPLDRWLFADDAGYHVQTHGVGVWQITDTVASEKPNHAVDTFKWENEHYTVEVQADGTLKINEARLGRFVVYADHGDTYSDERGELLGDCKVTDSLIIKQQSTRHTQISFQIAWQNESINVNATVKILFDQSLTINWTIDLDTKGTNFQVDMVFETAQTGTVFAGMPFDIVDTNLLPRKLDPELATILLGQREVIENRTYPMQEFVGIKNQTTTTMIMAKGIYGYQATENGCIGVSLRRSTEWLTKAELKNRVGDAGPFFYVPDARCERTTTHEFGLVIGSLEQSDLQRINAEFQNPPLIVQSNNQGNESEWHLFQADLPLSSLQVQNGNVIARVWNPTDTSIEAQNQTIEPKSITTLTIDTSAAKSTTKVTDSIVEIINSAVWRIGLNQSRPEEESLHQLETFINERKATIQTLESELASASGSQRYHIQHKLYARQRELREYQLSMHLNELKLANGGQLTHAYLYQPDEQVSEIGFELNRLRIKRRIYDYIVECV